MKSAIFLLLFSSQAFAAPGWFWRACDRIMMRGEPKIPASLMKVQTAMGNAVFRVNRTGEPKLREDTGPLEFLFDRPIGMEILPQPDPAYDYVRPVDMRVFAHPGASEDDWGDDNMGLGTGPSLVLLYENLTAIVDGNAVDADKIIRTEFQRIQERNPSLQMSLNLGWASEFPGLKFRSEYRNYRTAWVRGAIKNSQLKRTMLVMLTDAYSRINSAPRFAVKLPQPHPTKH